MFPVDAHGTQKIRLTYEHLLPSDGDRTDYVLPRTESIDYKVPWEVSVKIKSKRPIATVYSPSHRIEFRRLAEGVVSVEVSKEAMGEPGPLQLSCLRESKAGVTASLFAYPDAKIGGGYFLLLAGLPAKAGGPGEAGTPAVRRELTLVIDRSGSMAGEKLKQVKAAALQVVEGLADGEAFNVIDYSDSISSFAPKAVVKDKKNVEEVRHYLRRLTSSGGTNLHDALVEALRPKPTQGMLPIVLFLTDGLPTVGVRDEVAIRTTAIKANVHKRRIFTFGVGYDVNAPLLGHLARNSRATSTFVLPNEEIEAKVSQVFRRLAGPVLSAPELVALDAHGERSTRRVADLLPGTLPDLFEGDQLVVLGKYQGDEPLGFRLQDEFQGKPRTFKFDFKLDGATTKNSFVPRLWASRKIALLVDEIRQAGAGAGTSPSTLAAAAANDPKMKELTLLEFAVQKPLGGNHTAPIIIPSIIYKSTAKIQPFFDKATGMPSIATKVSGPILDAYDPDRSKTGSVGNGTSELIQPIASGYQPRSDLHPWRSGKRQQLQSLPLRRPMRPGNISDRQFLCAHIS